MNILNLIKKISVFPSGYLMAYNNGDGDTFFVDDIGVRENKGKVIFMLSLTEDYEDALTVSDFTETIIDAIRDYEDSDIAASQFVIKHMTNTVVDCAARNDIMSVELLISSY